MRRAIRDFDELHPHYGIEAGMGVGGFSARCEDDLFRKRKFHMAPADHEPFASWHW